MSRVFLSRILTRSGQTRTGIFSAWFVAAWCGLGWILERFAPNFHHRHVGGFWLAPRWHGLWVFVLLVATAVWCVHAALALREGAVSARQLDPPKPRTPIAFALGHLLLALNFAVYAWFVIAAPSEEFVVTEQWTDIHGESYRALRVEPRPREPAPAPDSAWRSRRPLAAWVERRVGSSVESMRLLRGNWWSSRVASYDLALARAQLSADGAVFRHGTQRVTLEVNRPVRHGVALFLLRALHHHHHEPADAPQRAELEIGGEHKELANDPEWAGENAFLGMKERPVLMLRVHRKLTTPLAILTASLAVLGWLLRLIASRSRAGAPD